MADRAIRQRRAPGVDPVPPAAHTTTPQYAGDDIAMGITMQLNIGDRRSIVIQTHTTRDCEDKELNGVLDKITRAMDRINARYRIRELESLIKSHKGQLAGAMENYSETMERWKASFPAGRRGGFQLQGQQVQQHEAMIKMQERFKNDLRDMEAELAEQRRMVG